MRQVGSESATFALDPAVWYMAPQNPMFFSCAIHGMTCYALHMLDGLEFNHTQARATQLTADSSTRAGEAEVNRIRQEHEAQQASNGIRVRGKDDLPESNDSHIAVFFLLSTRHLNHRPRLDLDTLTYFSPVMSAAPHMCTKGYLLFVSIAIVCGYIMQPLHDS